MQNSQNSPIWNPSTVASLSFIFTPAFGSYLQASNWNALGQPERASASKAWFYVSLCFLIVVAAAVCFGDKVGGDTDTRAGVNGGEGDLGPYLVAYAMLAYGAPDITVSSKNVKPWDKEWKTHALQGCTEHQSPELCACKMAQFEKLVTQDDMQRIGYTIQSNALVAAKYTNFIALSEALNKQCPLPQGITSVLAPSGQAAPAPARVEEPAKPVVQAAPVRTPAAPATQPVRAAVAASFDCGKASSKIEKLICSTPETGDADRRLAAAYASAKSKSNDANALKADQLAWMKQQRNACNDTACLLKTTEARIQALSAM